MKVTLLNGSLVFLWHSLRYVILRGNYQAGTAFIYLFIYINLLHFIAAHLTTKLVVASYKVKSNTFVWSLLLIHQPPPA